MVSPTRLRAAEFKSAYGPRYHFEPNVHGWNKTAIIRLGLRSAFFGGAAGVGALLFVSGIPRVRQDILEKIPVVGKLFVREQIHPADNPF